MLRVTERPELRIGRLKNKQTDFENVLVLLMTMRARTHRASSRVTEGELRPKRCDGLEGYGTDRAKDWPT
jgi:hypothetical protein